jgi:hypothetical protein
MYRDWTAIEHLFRLGASCFSLMKVDVICTWPPNILRTYRHPFYVFNDVASIIAERER